MILDHTQDFNSLVRLWLFLVNCVPTTSLAPLLAIAKDVRKQTVSSPCWCLITNLHSTREHLLARTVLLLYWMVSIHAGSKRCRYFASATCYPLFSHFSGSACWLSALYSRREGKWNYRFISSPIWQNCWAGIPSAKKSFPGCMISGCRRATSWPQAFNNCKRAARHLYVQRVMELIENGFAQNRPLWAFQAMMHKTPVTPRMSPKTPLGHSAEETLNLILDSLNVWTLQTTAGQLLDWMTSIDRSSLASPGHEVGLIVLSGFLVRAKYSLFAYSCPEVAECF